MAETAHIDVAHVAKLARINLTEEETRLFQAQLERVLEYAEMATSSVSPFRRIRTREAKCPDAWPSTLRAA